MNDETHGRLAIQPLPEGAATVLRARREVDAMIARTLAEAARAKASVHSEDRAQAGQTTRVRFSQD